MFNCFKTIYKIKQIKIDEIKSIEFCLNLISAAQKHKIDDFKTFVITIVKNIENIYSKLHISVAKLIFNRRMIFFFNGIANSL